MMPSPVRAAALLVGAFALLARHVAMAQGAALEPAKIPAEVRPFVQAGTSAIALESADLNGDGRADYVLVLERPLKGDEVDPIRHRPLLLLIRQSDGRLALAKRNDKAVMCASCGGLFGDPFMGITVKPQSFIIDHFGGSGWRWERRAQFNYSRRDNTWQLVRAEQASFHVGDPDARKLEVFVPPKDYGKIDIADFDPDDFLGKGPK